MKTFLLVYFLVSFLLLPSVVVVQAKEPREDIPDDVYHCQDPDLYKDSDVKCDGRTFEWELQDLNADMPPSHCPAVDDVDAWQAIPLDSASVADDGLEPCWLWRELYGPTTTTTTSTTSTTTVLPSSTTMEISGTPSTTTNIVDDAGSDGGGSSSSASTTQDGSSTTTTQGGTTSAGAVAGGGTTTHLGAVSLSIPSPISLVLAFGNASARRQRRLAQQDNELTTLDRLEWELILQTHVQTHFQQVWSASTDVELQVTTTSRNSNASPVTQTEQVQGTVVFASGAPLPPLQNVQTVFEGAFTGTSLELLAARLQLAQDATLQSIQRILSLNVDRKVLDQVVIVDDDNGTNNNVQNDNSNNNNDNDGPSSQTLLIVVIVAGISVACLAVVLIGFCYHRTRRANSAFHNDKNRQLQTAAYSNKNKKSENHRPPLFDSIDFPDVLESHGGVILPTTTYSSPGLESEESFSDSEGLRYRFSEVQSDDGTNDKEEDADGASTVYSYAKQDDASLSVAPSFLHAIEEQHDLDVSRDSTEEDDSSPARKKKLSPMWSVLGALHQHFSPPRNKNKKANNDESVADDEEDSAYDGYEYGNDDDASFLDIIQSGTTTMMHSAELKAVPPQEQQAVVEPSSSSTRGPFTDAEVGVEAPAPGSSARKSSTKNKTAWGISLLGPQDSDDDEEEEDQGSRLFLANMGKATKAPPDAASVASRELPMGDVSLVEADNQSVVSELDNRSVMTSTSSIVGKKSRQPKGVLGGNSASVHSLSDNEDYSYGGSIPSVKRLLEDQGSYRSSYGEEKKQDDVDMMAWTASRPSKDTAMTAATRDQNVTVLSAVHLDESLTSQPHNVQNISNSTYSKDSSLDVLEPKSLLLNESSFASELPVPPSMLPTNEESAQDVDDSFLTAKSSASSNDTPPSASELGLPTSTSDEENKAPILSKPKAIGLASRARSAASVEGGTATNKAASSGSSVASAPVERKESKSVLHKAATWRPVSLLAPKLVSRKDEDTAGVVAKSKESSVDTLKILKACSSDDEEEVYLDDSSLRVPSQSEALGLPAPLNRAKSSSPVDLDDTISYASSYLVPPKAATPQGEIFRGGDDASDDLSVKSDGTGSVRTGVSSVDPNRRYRNLSITMASF